MRIHQTSLLIFPLLISLLSTRGLSDDSDQPINDASIKVQFERKLGKLKDEEKTTDTDLISTQLKEQNKIDTDLPEITPQTFKALKFTITVKTAFFA